MQFSVYNWSKEVVDSVDLRDEVFATDYSPSIIKSVIDWQLAKRRSGSHKTKTISEVSGTTKKPFKQKGTGNARQGSLRSPHMRGGSVMHGPVIRSHEFSLQKKVRKLGLRHAISSKSSSDYLTLVDNLDFFADHKTAFVDEVLQRFSGKSFLIVSDELSDNYNLRLATQNLPNVLFLPQIGLNVYDVIKHEALILTLNAAKALEARL